MTPKDPKKPAPAPAKARGLSVEEMRLKKSIAASPMFRAVSGNAPPLPEVLAPSLEGLEVTLKVEKEEITEGEVAARLEAELMRAHQVLRAPGASVEEGDVVELDTVGYCEGALLPGSVNQGLELVIGPEGPLAAMAFLLVGKEIGKTHQLELLVPDDCPQESLRGKRAAYAVHVHSAATLPEIKQPTAEILKKLGKGNSVPEVLAALTGEILESREAAAKVRETRAVMDEVLARTKSQLPEELVDHEIGRLWREGEGGFLLRLDVPATDRDRSLQQQLEDPALRADVRRRLAITQAVRAVALSLNLAVSPDEFRAFAARLVEQAGIQMEELAVEFEANEQARIELYSQAMYEKTLELILSKAKVAYQE